MHIIRLSLPVLLIVFLFGCSPSNELGTTVVTGTVMVDGQPMEGVTVIFSPADTGVNPAVGLTDKNGKFKLSTPGGAHGNGAIPGSYIPTFAKDEIERREADSREDYMKRYGNTMPKVTHHIPKKYANHKTSGIDPVTVEKGKPNVFSFELSIR